MHALPILQANQGRATLGLVLQELEHTSIPPEDVSRPDTPGGLGNVERASLGNADVNGFYTGRVYLEAPEKHLKDQEIGQLIRAGWELAYHGIDHTPQTSIVAQVDGPGKLARGYRAGKDEIERLLRSFPSRHHQVQVKTNTLPLNSWNQDVRQVAQDVFDWTEIRWSGSLQHVPVIYGTGQDPHGDYRSIDFNRATFAGLEDLDGLVRLVVTDGGGWLIFQVHDVVDQLSDSPDPPTAMLTGEYRYLVEQLKAAGAQFVTFSEGARLIRRPHAGNRLRNTRFGIHSFLRPDEDRVLDWLPSVDPVDGAVVRFFAEGTVSLESSLMPASLALVQPLDPYLLRRVGTLVLRMQTDTTEMSAGTVQAGLMGPSGAHLQDMAPGNTDFCLEISLRRLIGNAPLSAPGAVSFKIQALGLQGRAVLGHLSLLPFRKSSGGCRGWPAAGRRR